MRKNNLLRAGAAMVAAAFLLTACSGDAGGAESDKVVMYATNNQYAVGAVVDAAAAQDPALKVETVTGDTTPLLDRIKSEGENTLADLFYSAVPEIMGRYSDQWEPYDSPEAKALPEELIQPDHLWTVQNTHVTAWMVNTDQFDGLPAPKSWKDLTDPKWKGKILCGNPAKSGTSDTALFGAYLVLGEEGFKSLWDNIAQTSNTDTLYPAVAQGEYAISLGYEANIYPYIQGGQAGIELVYPEDGTFVNYEAIAIPKNAKNPEAAKRLADTILSKDTQIELLKNSFRRPTRTDIDPAEYIDIPAIEDLKIVPSDRVEFADKYAAYQTLYESMQ